MYLEFLKKKEVEGLKIARDRIKAVFKQKLGIDDVETLIKEVVSRKMVASGCLDADCQGDIGFEAIDTLLMALDILLVRVKDTADQEQAADVVRILERVNKETLKSTRTILIDLESEEPDSLGKRSLSSASEITPERLEKLCRQKIDQIVSKLLKFTTDSDESVSLTLDVLSPHILQLMSNPLLLSEFA